MPMLMEPMLHQSWLLYACVKKNGSFNVVAQTLLIYQLLEEHPQSIIMEIMKSELNH